MLLAEIAPKAGRQSTLFDDPDQMERSDLLNRTMDALNTRFARCTLEVAGAGAGACRP